MKQDNYTNTQSTSFSRWMLFAGIAMLSLFATGVKAANEYSLTATGGTLSATYSTLGAAFTAINAGTHTGDIVISITANPVTTEGTTPATLHSSGAGSASYTTLLIQPAVDAVTISGNPVTGFGVIQLNGADNVTIDGDNPNTGGTNRNLTVSNTTTTTVIANSAIRIATSTAVTSANSNTIKNCILNGNVTGGNSSGITSTSGSSNSSFGIYIGGNGGSTATTNPTAITSVTSQTAPSTTTVNNLTIDNNEINRCARAIVFNGASAAVCPGTLTVTNNVIGGTGTLTGNAPYASPSTTVYTKGIWVNGATSLNISNNTLQNILSYIGTTMNAIELVGSIGGSGGTTTIDNNTITGVATNATSSSNGILIASNSTNTTSISGNTISTIQAVGSTSSAFGISMSSNSGVFSMTGNTISNVQTASSAGAAGITITGNTAASGLVNRNKVSTVYARTTGGYYAYGINLSAGNNITCQNNMIWDLNASSDNSNTGTTFGIRGIRINAGTGHKIYHNTVSMYGAMLAGGTGADVTAALTVASSSYTGIDVRNNIFSNTMTGGNGTMTHTCIQLPSGLTSAFNMTLNNNAYFGSGTVVVGATTAPVLYTVANFSSASTAPSTNWRSYSSTLNAAGTNDNASIASASAAPFTSSVDLHIPAATSTQLESGGASLGVLTDIDNDFRFGHGSYAGSGVAPDMGADEFAGVLLDISAPAISYSLISNGDCLGSRSFSATITDASGVNVTGGTAPRVYFKKSSNANADGGTNDNTTDGWKYYESTTGSSPFSFTIDPSLIFGGVAATDVIQYFVVAQDLAGTPNVGINSGTFAAAQTSVALAGSAFPIGGSINSYTITATALAVTSSASPATICVSGSSTITAFPTNGTANYTYSWSPGGATTASVSTGTISSAVTYTVTVTDACGATATSSTTVTVNTPSVTSPIGGTRCGTGTVSLSATLSSGANLNWYAASSGGAILSSSSTFTTPTISTTTDYYVAASNVGAASTTAVGAGAGTSSSSSISPYYHGYGGQKSQFIILASELTTAGLTAGTTINSVAFNITSLGTATLNEFAVSVGHTSQAAAVTNTPISGLTQVYTNAAQALNTGLNPYAFTGGFVWNGTSNLVVQVCYSNNNSGGTSSTVKTDAAGFTSSLGIYADNATGSAVCAATTSTGLGTLSSNGTSATRPQMTFGITGLCESARTMVTATITAPAAISIAGAATICDGQSVTLTASSIDNPSGYDYTWSPGGQTTAAVSVSPSTTTIYTASALDNTAGPYAGCATTATATVTVNPVPSAVSVSPPTTNICAGGSQLLTASGGSLVQIASNSITVNMSNPTTDEGNGSSGTGGYLCPGNNLVSSFTLPAIPGNVVGARLTITGVTLGSGSYASEVRLYFSGAGITGTSACFQGNTGTSSPTTFNWVTGNGGTSGDTAALAALLNPAGGAVTIYYGDAYNDNTTGPDATFPATATLQYYYQLPAPTFAWSPGGGTGATLNASPAITTTYTATATASNGCTTSGTADVNVSDLNVSGVTTDATCFGVSDGILEATGLGGASSYEFSLNGTSWQTSTTFSGLAAGTYTLYVKDAEPCTTSVGGFVIGSPAQLIVSASTAYSGFACDGDDVTMTATSGFVSYNWTGPNAYSDNVNPSVITGAGLVANGTYTVTVSDGSCSEIATTDVTLNPVGTISVSLASGANPSCAGTPVTFTATPTNAPSPTYDFYLNTVSVQNSASDTYSYTPVDGDQLYVVLSQVASGCASGSPATSNTVTQNVDTVPTAPTISAGGPLTFCANIADVTLTSSYVGGNVWSTTATTDAITTNTTGSYTVTYTDGNGCSATSAATVVTANTSAVAITSSNPGGLCTGATVTLTANATPAASTYLWGGSETTQAISVTASGTYNVSTTDANGCTATNSIVVSDVALPTASISGNATICTGTTETLTATATAGSGTISTYQWVLNGSTNVGTNSATYGATAPGSYTVVVTNSNGCSVTSAAHVLANTGPLSGAYTISTNPASCSNYTSFALAFSDLNARGVSGNVTFTVASGYTEVAPAGGLSLNMCALSSGLVSNSAQTISFVSAGAPNPVITAGVGTSTTLDAIVKLVGADYVTFNGINLAESAGNTTSTTRAEWGYALLKCDGNNGANYNNIINCSVTLNKAYTSTRAVYSGNHTAASTTSLTYSGTANDPAQVDAARNGHNTFYGNSIQNTYGAFSLNGNSSASVDQSLNDTLNAIGVIGQAANVITDFGGTSTACTVIASANQRGITIDNNTITGGTGSTSTLTGINPGAGVWGKIRNNQLTLTTSATTSAIVGIGISFSGGSLVNPNIVTVSGNTVTMSSITLTTAAATGISCTASGTGAQITVRSNSVSGCTFNSATTGGFNGITQTHNSASTVNDVSKNTVNSNSLSGTGQFLGVNSFNANTPTLSTLSMDSNTVSLNTKGSTGSMFCVYNGVGTAGSLTMTQNGNTVNGNVIAGGAAACTLVGITAQATNFTMNGNAVTNNSVTTVSGTAAGNVLAIQSSGLGTVSSAITNNTVNGVVLGGVSSGASLVRGILAATAATDNRTISGNNISNVSTSFTTSATCIGIITVAGGTTNIVKNKIYDFFPGQNSTVFSGSKGIIIAGGTTNNVTNNLIGFDFSAATPVLISSNCVVGLEVSAGTASNLYYNTVRLAGNGTGTSFSSSGINLTVTTANVTIKNNLVINAMGAGGTGAAASVGLRRTATALTGYNSASNNNLWYAGAASTSHLLYYDGSNSDFTIAAFKARVSPAESASQTGNPTLLSVVGSNANFLHVNAAVSTLAESGGIAISGINDDYDGDIRQGSGGYAGTGTAPDIGADEFNGIASAPALTNAVVTPTVSCTASSHTISINATTAAGVIDSVKLAYSFNGTAQTAITMTVPTSGSTYTFTVPAATPSNAVVTWSVSAYNSGGFSSVYNGTSYQDNYLVAPSVVATPDTICLGGSITLAAGGPAPAAPAASTYCASTHSSGCSLGDEITNVSLNTLSNASACAATPYYTNYSGLGGATTTTIAVSGNPHTLSVSFGTDGNQYSGAWIDYNHNGVYEASEFLGASANGGASGTATIVFSIPGTAYNGLTHMRVIGGNDTAPTSGQACGASSSNYGETEDYDVTITGGNSFAPVNPIFTSFSWSDGVNTYTGNPATATPSASGTYTYTLTAGDGVCSVTSTTGAVVVRPIPAAPSAIASTQCGNGVPECSVQGTVGAVYNWFDAATGGTLLQSGLDTTYTTSINATDTFYVSETGANGCLGDRVMVIATVTSPDPIEAGSTSLSICPNETIDLSVIQTGSNNTYDLTWTASPSAGSGITGSVSGSPAPVTPILPGTYTYIVTAVDVALSCTIQDSVSVLVNNVPTITSVSADPDTICDGSSTTLTAITPQIGPGTVTVGAGASTVGSDYSNPFYSLYSNQRDQILIKASELQAAGMYAGNITSLGFELTAVGANPMLDFSVHMGHTNMTAMASGVWETGLTPTYANASYQPVLGVNTISFTTNFVWNGTSNIIVQTCWGNSASSASTSGYTIKTDAPGYTCLNNSHPSVATSGSAVCVNTTTYSTYSARPQFFFGAITQSVGTGTYSWLWNPGSLSGNQVTVSPSSPTTYTVTATDPATTCTNSASVNVFVNPSPVAPTAVNGSHCGNQTPTCSVIGNGGDYFTWHTDPTGSSFIAGQSGSSLVSYPRSQTDTFYVSETFATGPCEGPRVMVIETYTAADAIVATATVPNDTICPLGTVTLDATQGTTNTYTSYEWTTIPAGGTATGQNTTGIAPNIPGQLIWKVTASDGTCVTEAYDTIYVAVPPAITSYSQSDTVVCPGLPVTLSVVVPATLTVPIFNENFETFPLTTFAASNDNTNLTTATQDATYFTNGTSSVRLTYPVSTLGNLAMTSGVDLTGKTNPRLVFKHIAAIEATFDLGAVEYSLNGGTTWLAFPIGDYLGSGTLVTSTSYNSGAVGINFSKASYPNWVSVLTSSAAVPDNTLWQTETISLAAYTSSTNFRIRFRLTSDTSVNYYGWLIDGVSVEDVVPNPGITYQWTGTPSGTAGMPGTTTTPSIVVNPTDTTVYTVQVFDASNACYNQATMTVNTYPEPLAPTNPVDLVQCGSAVPLISVTRSGASTDSFKWFTVASGGTAIAGETDSVLTSLIVSATTTFHVAEFNGDCEGPRTAVTVTVNQPDLVTINASATSVCLPVSPAITLDAVQTGSTSNYIYTWSATPSGTAGLSGTSGPNVTATPTAAGNYTYTVTAVDAGASCTTIVEQIISVNNYPVISTVSATPGTICAGDSVNLKAQTFAGAPGVAQIGTATTTTSTYPYYRLYGSSKTQMLYRASELTAAGLLPGNITSLGFYITSAGGVIPNMTISMKNTASTTISAFEAGMTSVGTYASYTPVVGISNHAITPFNWNGTSNIIVEVCFANNDGGAGSSTVRYSNPGYASVYKQYQDNNTTMCTTPAGTTSPSSTIRPNLYLNGTIGTNVTNTLTWTWNPGSISGSSVTVYPDTSTTYTVTAASGVCTKDTTVSVVVNPLPGTPVATNSTQCGIGTPTCSVAGGAGTFRWYLNPVGGSALAGQAASSLSSYPISVTDTFYVSEFNGTCESLRAMVIATVDPVDTLTATLSSDTICLGSNVTLIAVQTGPVGNTFTTTWTASPDTSLSGITGSATGSSVVITPTKAGTYVYTVHGVDGACNSQPSTVTLVVLSNPTINIGPDMTICSGGSTVLTASNLSVSGYGSASMTINLSNPTTDETTVCPGANLISSFTLPPLPGALIGARLSITGVALGSGSYGSEVRLNFSGSGITGTSPCFYGASSSTTPNPFNWITGSYTAADTATLAALLNPAGGTVNIYYNEGYNDNTSGPDATFPATATLQYYYIIPTPVTWSSDPAGISGTGTTLNTGALTASHTIYATATSNFGCTTTDTLDITVVTSPGLAYITASSDTICNTGTVTLTADSLAIGSTIQWQSSPSGLVDTWTNVGTDSLKYNTGAITANTYYRLFATCSGTDTSASKLIVVAVPTISGTNASRCGVGPITLTATSNGDVSWFSGSSGGTALFTGNPYTPTLTATTTYWLQGSIGTCINTGGRVPVSATLNTAPAVSFTTSATSVCNGELVTLTASTTNPDYDIYWSNDGSTIIHTGNPYVFAPTATANYYVVAIDSSGGAYDLCGAIDGPKTITWNEQPDVPVVSPSMTTVCTAGDSVLLTVTNPPAVSTGTATVGTGVVQNGTTSTTDMPPYGNYYTGKRDQMLILASDLLASGMVAGPITSLSFDVVSNAGTLAYTDFTVKVGLTTVTALSTTFEPAPVNTVWNAPSFTPVAGWNTHTFSPAVVWDGTSNLLVETYFSNCPSCSGTTCNSTGSGISYSENAVTNQTTKSYVAHSYYYSDANGCSPETQTIGTTTSMALPNMRFGAQIGTPVVYTWSPGAYVGQSVYVTPTTSTLYTVTSTIGPCSAMGTAQVDYTPINLVITPSGSTTFCGSGTVDLDAGSGYLSYSWSDGASVIATTQMITVSPTVSTTYTATVDSGACSVSKTIDVTVNPAVAINISPSSTAPICGGASNVTLTADAGYSNYVWSPGGETTQAITVSPVSTTTYTVSATDGNTCTQTGVYTVVSNPSPATPTITPASPVTMCWDGSDPGTFVTLTADTTGAGSGATIAWDDFFGTDVVNLDVYASEVGYGTSTHTITVSNSYGCVATASANVFTDPCAAGVNLDLRVFLEGYITEDWKNGFGGDTMRSTLYDLEQGTILTGPYSSTATDTIEVNLWTSASVLLDPNTTPPDYSEKVILNNNGRVTVNFATAPAGDYYIAVKHKNTIETWSSNLVTFAAGTTSYDFSTALTQAYDDGSNPPMATMPYGVFALYSGDNTQDGTVDSQDMNPVYNDNNAQLYDYLNTDCTGDGTTDSQDMNFVYNNSNLQLFYARPY